MVTDIFEARKLSVDRKQPKNTIEVCPNKMDLGGGGVGGALGNHGGNVDVMSW